jgi:hypothetical protein
MMSSKLHEGMKVMARLTIPDVLPLVRDYYVEHSTGGSLHIVLDDGNVENAHVDFCIEWAIEHDDAEGEKLARLIRTMTKTQRRKLYQADKG